MLSESTISESLVSKLPLQHSSHCLTSRTAHILCHQIFYDLCHFSGTLLVILIRQLEQRKINSPKNIEDKNIDKSIILSQKQSQINCQWFLKDTWLSDFNAIPLRTHAEIFKELRNTISYFFEHTLFKNLLKTHILKYTGFISISPWTYKSVYLKLLFTQVSQKKHFTAPVLSLCLSLSFSHPLLSLSIFISLSDMHTQKF